jgi:hypothetical protein
MPALAEIAGLAKLPGASGVGVCQRDFPAVLEARHRLERDCRPPIRGVLPPDPQELRFWLHRLRPSRAWSQPASVPEQCVTVSAGSQRQLLSAVNVNGERNELTAWSDGSTPAPGRAEQLNATVASVANFIRHLL